MEVNEDMKTLKLRKEKKTAIFVTCPENMVKNMQEYNDSAKFVNLTIIDEVHLILTDGLDFREISFKYFLCFI